MVSAGTAYKLTFGIDRATESRGPISPKAEVVLIAGSNIAECAPITTHYIWQCREQRRQADRRRSAHDADHPQRRPLPAGAAGHRSGAVPGHAARDRARRPDERRTSSTQHTTGCEAVRESVREWTPERAAQITGVPPENIEKAAHWIGETDRAMGIHARGIEHQSKGVENCLAMINLFLATGNIGREGAGCMMITGQGNGQGGREHGQKCDQLPGHALDHRSRSAPLHRAASGASTRENCRAPVYRASRSWRRFTAGEIKALFSICFNPLVSLPDANFTREALSKLEFFGVIDFFLSETAHHADVVFAGSLQEEDEGVVCSAEGRVQKINKAVDPPGDARSDALIICDLAQQLGKGKYFDYPSHARDLRRAARGVARRHRRLLRHHLRADRAGARRLLAVPDARPSRHAAPVRGRPVLSPRRQGALSGHRVARQRRPARCASSRCISPPAAWSASTSPARRRAASARWSINIPSRSCEIHPRWPRSTASTTATGCESPRAASTMIVQAMVVKTIRPDTVFIPYHWPGRRSANRLTHRTLDPRSKIPEYKVSACRIEKASRAADLDETSAWRKPDGPRRCREPRGKGV